MEYVDYNDLTQLIENALKAAIQENDNRAKRMQKGPLQENGSTSSSSPPITPTSPSCPSPRNSSYGEIQYRKRPVNGRVGCLNAY